MKISIGLVITHLFISSIMLAQSPSFEWANSIGSIGPDDGRGIVTDAIGNVYGVGSFQNTVDFDAGPGIYNLTSQGNSDIYVRKMDPNGNLLWARAVGGFGADQAESIATDSDGNIYLTGVFRSTVDFDPGVGNYPITANGPRDIFILKLDGNGSFIWVKTMGGTGNDYGIDITVSSSNHIYVTGRFQNTVDFDPGVGMMNFTSNGGDDVFIQKLDTAGNIVWIKTMGGGDNDRGESIITDATGGVYITGQFLDTVDFDPGIGVNNYISAGQTDVFIQKLNANGNLIWVKTIGSPDYDFSWSIIVDYAGDLYIAGSFFGTVDFDPGIGVNNLTSNGSADSYVLKLDSAASFLWVRSMGGTSQDEAYSIASDALGNLYITGYYQGTADFNLSSPGIDTLTSIGSFETYIQQLDEFGNHVWVFSIGDADYDQGTAITVGAFGAIYATGVFSLSPDFDPGTGVLNLTSQGTVDAFVIKLGMTVGLTEQQNNSEVSIFPNPINDQLTILGAFVIKKIEIIDFQGRLIKEIFPINNRIKVADISSGIYLLRIMNDEGVVTQKMIKK